MSLHYYSHACVSEFALACVAGVNGEGEEEQERRRKMGVGDNAGARDAIFLPRSCSPSPSPFAPATQAKFAWNLVLADSV